MASNMKTVLKGNRDVHHVGTYTTFAEPITLTNGAVVIEDGGVDNFCLVELSYVDGVASCKYATAAAKRQNMFLAISHEEVLESYGEKFCDFYNEKGDLATIAYLTLGHTFETSAVTGADDLEIGDLAVWDVATKTYKKYVAPTSDSTPAPEVMFRVQGIEDNEQYSIDSVTLVEFAIIQ